MSTRVPIAIARPTDGKQVTAFIILFIMLGQLAMGMLVSFSSTWWALPITALALIGYFLLRRTQAAHLRRRHRRGTQGLPGTCGGTRRYRK